MTVYEIELEQIADNRSFWGRAIGKNWQARICRRDPDPDDPFHGLLGYVFGATEEKCLEAASEKIAESDKWHELRQNSKTLTIET